MILSTLLVLFVIAGLTVLFHWYSIRWKLRKLPGPKPLPVIGNLGPFLTSKDDFRRVLYNFIHTVCDEIEEQGLGVVYFGPNPYLFVTKPEFVSEILRDTRIINKGEDYIFLNAWLGKGLLTSNGKQWKDKRRLLSPTFHSQILEDYIPAMNEQIDKFISILNDTNEEYIDIRPMFTNLTLDVISATAMGVSLDTQSNENQEYLRCVNDALLLVVQRVYSLVNRFDFIYQLTSDGQRFFKTCANLKRHTLNILKQKKQEMDNDYEYSTNVKHKMSFMDLLLKKQKMDASITDEDIRGDVDTFMVAGYDTSAACLKWAFLVIGNDERVQRKIRDELYSIFGDDNKRHINRDDLSKMNYIECVVKEALRLYPPIPIIARFLDKEITLNGYTIPQGLNVLLHLHKSHRNATVFPNPSAFIPERFLEMDPSTYQTAFTPFAAGLRNCIGQRFAMLEMKLVLAHIFRHFTVKALNKENEIESAFEALNRPISEIRIKFKKLND